jgi:hypothetical protein
LIEIADRWDERRGRDLEGKAGLGEEESLEGRESLEGSMEQSMEGSRAWRGAEHGAEPRAENLEEGHHFLPYH